MEVKMKKIVKIMPALFLVFVALVGIMFGNIFITSNITKAEEVVVYDGENYDTKIIVKGEAEAEFEADNASVYLQVETLDIDRDVSIEKNKQLLENVVNALVEEGIEKEGVSITYFSSYPTKDSFTCSTGERTCTTLCYEVKDLSKLIMSIQKVEQIGATVNSINFTLSDYQIKYNDLLTLAIENAKAKAKKILGKDEINVLKIKEECFCCSNSKYQSYGKSMTEDLLQSKINISAEVEIIAY